MNSLKNNAMFGNSNVSNFIPFSDSHVNSLNNHVTFAHDIPTVGNGTVSNLNNVAACLGKATVSNTILFLRQIMFLGME